MDQVASQSSNQMCTKHSQKKIKFVQVNNLSNSQNNHLFYCTHCINKDLAFQGINYLLISQIIEEGETNIIQKWPPLNDYSILDKLIEFTEQQDTSPSVIDQIHQYFTQLKEEFLRKIDLCEKKMINHALDLPFGNESILKQYQQISKISTLKSILLEGQNKDFEIYQQSCKQFISEVEAQKEQNSELLTSLLQQCHEKESLINFEYPNLIKESIFSFIDEIDFFNSTHITNSQTISNSEVLTNKNASAIMKLISNKSNFCSQSFLSQISVLLEKVSPLLQSLSFESMFEQNKSPIDFSELSEIRMDIMREFVEHSVQVQKCKEYSVRVANSFEYQILKQIIDSNVNFVNSNLKEQLQQLLIDVYPLLKQVNFTNATFDKNKFDCFRQLSDEEIEDLFKLMKMKQALIGETEFNQSQTKHIQEQTHKVLKHFENVNEIFRRYPIYDLLTRKKIKERPIEIKLTKTNYADGNNRTEINQNSNQVSMNQSYYIGKYKVNYDINCVSDIILEKDKKYIFRFQIEHQRSDDFFIMLGLMQRSKCDISYGYNDNLTCYLKNINNQIQYNGGYGIDKQLKGDKLKLSKENEVEMRIWIGGQQLEILDYPHYEYKVGVTDINKKLLASMNDLKLYIGLYQEQIKVSLRSAVQVDYLPN